MTHPVLSYAIPVVISVSIDNFLLSLLFQEWVDLPLLRTWESENIYLWYKLSKLSGFKVDLFFKFILAGSDGAATSYQVKQLEQQNNRLKEALVK